MMEKQELRKCILEHGFSADGERFYRSFSKMHKEVYDELIEYTSFLPPNTRYGVRAQFFLNDLTDLLTCPECGQKFSFDKVPKIYCSTKCANRSSKTRNKTRETCLKKYGVDNPRKSKRIIEKTKQTCIDKYGVDHQWKSSDVRDKVKYTCIERYGVENAMQSPEIKDKVKDTCLERYGKECVFQLDRIRDKAIEKQIKDRENINKRRIKNSLLLYGTEHPSQNEIVREKISKGCKTASVKMIEKYRQTCLDRYGVPNARSSLDLSLPDNSMARRVLSDRDQLATLYNKFKSCDAVARQLGIAVMTVYNHLKKNDIDILYDTLHPSSLEHYFHSLLDKEQIEYISNSRKIIPPYELDIYLPRHDLAIEIDGVYWHTELKGRDKNYHLNKTLNCAEMGIQLLHIWDTDNIDIWKSVLCSKLGLTQRLYARETSVKRSNTYEFIAENHLQGAIDASIEYALFYEGIMVAAMTFNKSRFNKKYDWELLRFCTKQGYTVIGGASKLLKRFKMNYPGSILSYANMRWSDGNLYNALGFKLLHRSAPNYFYTKNYRELHSRNRFQKHMLENKLDNFDENLTEWCNMQNNGWDRIWDCGNLVYAFD